MKVQALGLGQWNEMVFKKYLIHSYLNEQVENNLYKSLLKGTIDFNRFDCIMRLARKTIAMNSK